MNEAIIKSIAPKLASGAASFLRRHGDAAINELFDSHGFRVGFIKKAELARACFPKLSEPGARNYLHAMVEYLVAEGRETGCPQIESIHGAVRFDIGGRV